MKLPKRVEQHISETASFKIFSSKIPNNWIIRDITEKDYGIDCYIELVNEKNELTGELISIQLKSRKSIEWNSKEPTKWNLSGIEISSSNYWYNFSVPVFICVVDQETREVFFLNVRQYIKENYLEYAKQDVFSYKIDRRNKLEGNEGLRQFLSQYIRDKHRKDLEDNIVTFFANYTQFKEFYYANTGRDQFMGVEYSRILFAKHFYNNLRFLSNYLNINWDLLKFIEYEKLSHERYGNDYKLYEEQLDEIVTKLNEKTLNIALGLKELISVNERQYWIRTNLQLFNFAINLQEDSNYNDW